jgi:hypothetical protein
MTTVQVEATPVRVVNHPEPDKYEVRAAYRSVVLTAANPAQQVAGYDPLRKLIRFSPASNPYVISGSISQASDPNNLVASATAPNGRYVPANLGTEVLTEGQNDVWVSAGTYPTIIGFEIVRKVPE